MFSRERPRWRELGVEKLDPFFPVGHGLNAVDAGGLPVGVLEGRGLLGLGNPAGLA